MLTSFDPDVAPLAPEARPIARAAAEVYAYHTRPWLIGVLAHGSALKGGFIPGCSDVDMQVYLAREAFDGGGRLPLALGLAIQRDLARIPLGPFQYIQGYARCRDLPDGLTGPVPGAYHMVLGATPIPEASADDLLASAHRALDALRPVPEYIAHGLLTYSQPRLERHARLMCTDVWPLIFQALALTAPDPIAVWRLTKSEAITRLPIASGLRAGAEAFHRVVTWCYADGRPAAQLLDIIAKGVAFRSAATAWYQSTQPQPTLLEAEQRIECES